MIHEYFRDSSLTHHFFEKLLKTVEILFPDLGGELKSKGEGKKKIISEVDLFLGSWFLTVRADGSCVPVGQLTVSCRAELHTHRHTNTLIYCKSPFSADNPEAVSH